MLITLPLTIYNKIQLSVFSISGTSLEDFHYATFYFYVYTFQEKTLCFNTRSARIKLKLPKRSFSLVFGVCYNHSSPLQMQEVSLLFLFYVIFVKQGHS